MNDMTAAIEPKSDQINADDFMAGPMTYTIAGVDIKPGTEQPVSVKLAGEAKVWRPCKSSSRVLVAAWGPDAKVYQGRSVTLYRDPTVKWGGMDVGGIRISHMSHIDKTLVLALTASKGNRRPHTVKPLETNPPKPAFNVAAWAADFRANIPNATDGKSLWSQWCEHKNELRALDLELFAAMDAEVVATGKALAGGGEQQNTA